jgi:CRISPR/Cas system-associated exonuclease Cas4 (RecB family)
MSLRPSSLPKIAVCACYEGDPTGSKYSDRGTAIDVVFRAMLSGDPVGLETISPDDLSAAQWAVDTARILAGDDELEAREEHLRIEALGLNGTADLLCAGGRWSADLKSGEKRNYREQQAAYALGFMIAHFEDEWTVYLFYCDQREVDRLHFSRDEAEEIVRKMIARGTDPQRTPTPNEYCGWCANRFRCLPRLEMASPLVSVCDTENPEEAFEAILADNDRLGAFLKATKVVSELNDKAREVARDRLVEGKAAGVKIPGVSLVTKRGGQILAAEHLMPVIEQLGVDDILAELGSLSRAKAEKLFAKAGLEFPVDQLTETAGSCYVQVRG